MDINKHERHFAHGKDPHGIFFKALRVHKGEPVEAPIVGLVWRNVYYHSKCWVVIRPTTFICPLKRQIKYSRPP